MTLEVSTRSEEVINQQIANLAKWLKQNYPHVFDEQIHLDEGTQERAYWHYGYLTALRDIQQMIHE